MRQRSIVTDEDRHMAADPWRVEVRRVQGLHPRSITASPMYWAKRRIRMRRSTG